MSGRRAFLAPRLFDGFAWQDGRALVVDGSRVEGHAARDTIGDIPVEMLEGGVICPGFVDLQVNGGGGILLNDGPSVEGLRRIAEAHASVGATSILPTLISDSIEVTRAAVDGVEAAISAGVPGLLGVHLEGPHLAVAKKGAHDARFLRPMNGADLEFLTEAARRLPFLMITLAPEVVTPDQIAALTRAGICVSLGHSGASFDQCLAAIEAGARGATHLFNAMSPLQSRDPGLVGATLATGAIFGGIIADGVHVHPDAVSVALRAKADPGPLFLVSDAMAVAGTTAKTFTLNGRKIERRGGRLTLADGTLAGADLDLPTAVRNLVKWQAAAPGEALAMASRIPAEFAGAKDGIGTLRPGAPADFLHFDPAGAGAVRVWKSGALV